ncbi:MAG: 2-aminoethylphosphonate--pyruvate transaminase [Leptospiraceae bacterium]|nr:2-aminoethylphosphonate--pyruvate transaminase [Leptospiraceae bacterium]
MSDFFNPDLVPANPYLLLTPGPLSTSPTVRAAMLRDWCTWDDDYNSIVQDVRRRLVDLANMDGTHSEDLTAVLMQGSGTFSVEATIGSQVPENGRLLVLANGAYGQRIARIARVLRIDLMVHDAGETHPPDLERLHAALQQDSSITHVAVVHCETTTGMLNPVYEIGEIVKAHNRTLILDAMSSFAGVRLNQTDCGADFLISSANKCIQGVPGFGFVLATGAAMRSCAGRARSLSLDLFDQWEAMETGKGKWRYTSPTHTVRAFARALLELEQEGIVARQERYRTNQRILRDGMRAIGFRCLLKDECQSPIITAFYNPDDPTYSFTEFYNTLKERGFVIYPGKVSEASTFRIGTIGHVFPEDIQRLLYAVQEAVRALNLSL